jgi:hypothetical protein
VAKTTKNIWGRFDDDFDTYSVSGFAGLNTNKNSTDIEDNQAQDLLNVIFTKELEKRGGYTALNSTEISGSSGIYMVAPYYYNNGATRKLMYISHTTCGEINAGTGAITAIKTGLTTNLRTRSITFHDLFIYTNGTDAVQKIDEATPGDLAGSPPVSKYIALHKNYVFLAGNSTYPSRLYWCDLDMPETWTGTNFLDINPDDGSVITGLQRTLDTLVIGKDYNTYVLYGDVPEYTEGLELWRIKEASTETGSASQGSMERYGKTVIYLSRGSGFQMFGGDVTSDETSVDTLTSYLMSRDITPTVSGLNESRLSQAEAIIFDYKYICAVPNASSTTNNLCLVYDFVAKGWTMWNIPANCWCKYRSSGVDYLYFGDPDDGYIYRYTPTTYSDNGTAINAYYQTKDHDLELSANDKIFRKFYVTLNKSEDYSMTVTPEVDFGEVDVDAYTIASKSSDSLWGTMVWGTDKWGAATTSTSDKNIMNARGKFINYTFSNSTLNETFRLRKLVQFFKVRSAR